MSDREKVVITPELLETLKGLSQSMLDEFGRELPNPQPLFVEVTPGRRLTLQQKIQRLLRVELSRQMYDQGMESWEEANDLNIDDDVPVKFGKGYEIMEDEIPIMKADLDPVEAHKKIQKGEPVKAPVDPDGDIDPEE